MPDTLPLRAVSGVLIPAYEAAACLGATLAAVLAKIGPDRVAVIDDGSRDGTAAVAEGSGVRCLRHGTNRGKGAALMTGLLWARERGWEWAVTMDADGQHAASDLDAFWSAPVTPETGIVVGKRAIRGTGMPWHRRFSNSVTTRMISRLARRPVYDAQCGFRMYRLAALEAMGLPREGRFEWESQALVLCGRRGFRILPVDIATVYTDNGSHMRLVPDTLRFLRMYLRLAAPEAAWTR
jgi:glycosyltransferase involved in cell wall biosynthesis